jgi:hypothetical protein
MNVVPGKPEPRDGDRTADFKNRWPFVPGMPGTQWVSSYIFLKISCHQTNLSELHDLDFWNEA